MPIHIMKLMLREIRSTFRPSHGIRCKTAKQQLRLMTTSKQRRSDRNNTEDFFSFTRGRFLRDETRVLSQRYVKFNVEELTRIAAEATGAHHCESVHKFADGMHNKALLLTMDNGTEVVGKIPNPNAGRPHFTTASEVATMDFMRSALGTPVPRVLSWSSKMENPVGTEYIIMENLPGVQLNKIWNELDIEVRLKVVKQIAKYQADWTTTSFSQFGSVYYKQDLPSAETLVYRSKDDKQIIDNRFTIGPSTSRQNTDDGRNEIEFDRGPWKTAEEYEIATGMREIACIEQFSQLPSSPIALYGPGTYRPSKAKKLEAARGYLKFVKYLLPDDESIQTSHIWHNDLHVENIFVNPNDPSEILGFLDWQSTELAPLYDHTIEPYILDYDGPRVEGLLERPKLAEIQRQFDSDPASQKKAERLFVKMSLVSLYRHLIHLTNPQLFRVLEFHQTTRFQLLLLARNLLVDGEATYLALLAEQQKNWSELPRVRAEGNPECPLEFSVEELATIKTDSEGAVLGISLMQDVQNRIGRQFFQAQGLVDHGQFDEAKKALRRVKKDLVQEYSSNEAEAREWENAWPFDD
ncbi:phosphotransferase enzyme family protein [Histoplasma capsulatum var. duboisii H88]|uniref:Phosphotransferase enzyme family protein n=1 Tax=Ajellomyces capsulatus (strain H88) TaxID=544711 RepID=F0UH30_AJEC8|nr:phosphotransferase enzyme family protein [Histoplasma capsulatum var. duboisii H88]QSS55983.1 phosphotransferase enzyme family protein [Histoplasma capsulatum var. duboisii H88]